MNALLPYVPSSVTIAKSAGPTTPVRTGIPSKTPTAFATPEYYGEHHVDSSGFSFFFSFFFLFFFFFINIKVSFFSSGFPFLKYIYAL